MLLIMAVEGGGMMDVLHHTHDLDGGKAHHQWTAHSRSQSPLTKAQNARGDCISLARNYSAMACRIFSLQQQMTGVSENFDQSR